MDQKRKLAFLSKNKQIIYNIILIVLIPSAIILNSVLFINDFKKTLDHSLRIKATAIGDVINVALLNRIDEPGAVQKTVEDINNFNDDVVSLDVLTYNTKNQAFQYVGSLEEEKLGKLTSATNLTMAWDKNWPIANLSTVPTDDKQENMRVWQVTMPLYDRAETKTGLLSMKVSLRVMDEFIGPVLTKSIIILLITLLVIVLLLLGNARLFEYAVLYNKIKEIDKMKDEFISMASHELRTPITVIQGYIDIMLQDSTGKIDMNEPAKTNLKKIQGSSERLRLLIEDLLNVSRIEQGRLKIDAKTTNPEPIIKETVDELKVKADEKGLSLKYVNEEDGLPGINIDADRFKQALINLIGNSVKYTKEGGIEVIAKADDAKKELRIMVKDTGIGMTAKEREHLFEKFYRVQNDDTAQVSGTGLGLWITKQIIELMKGEISVESMKGTGTQITLAFPYSGQSNKS